MRYLISIIIFFVSLEQQAACTKGYKSTIRERPSTKSSRIAFVSKHTPLRIIVGQNNWYKVKGYNFEGWVFHSLIEKDKRCMTVVNANNTKCPTYGTSIKRKVSYLESFKVLKMEIGCNYVEDRFGRKFWVSSTGAWPESSTKLLQIP